MSDTFLVSVSEIVNASPAAVWDTITDPVKVKQCFFGADVITDWKEGSPITYRGEWEGKEYIEKGNVIRVIPEKFLHTNYWSPTSGKADVPENYQNVKFTLEPVDGGTKFTIEQDGNDTEEIRDRAAGNWKMLLNEVKKLTEV